MKQITLFDHSGLNEKLKWYHEPSDWSIENHHLVISPQARTDFWQRTHYGFEVDNGHFLFVNVEGDFIMEASMSSKFQHQYDQAGLMVRVSDQCWMKSSLEFESEEPNKLGVVVTNHGYSDWSSQDVSDELAAYKMRVTRKNSDYKVEYYNESAEMWVQIRLFHLFDQSVVKAGIYCCSPKEAGFKVRFECLSIR